MRPVFLDTGYVIALEALDDQHHGDAIQQWRETAPELTPIVTTTYYCVSRDYQLLRSYLDGVQALHLIEGVPCPERRTVLN